MSSVSRVDAVGGDAVVSVGAGAEVCFGSGPLDRTAGGAASGGGGGARWTRRCSTMRSRTRAQTLNRGAVY